MGKKHKKHKSEKKSADGLEDYCGDSMSSSSQAPVSNPAEPLKLVLKVGLQEPSDTFASHSHTQATEERSSSKHKHKKKKKKKEGKEKEREEGSVDLKRSLPKEEQTEAGLTEHLEKKVCLEGEVSPPLEEGETIEDRVRHSPRSCAVRIDDGAILRQCLEYLHKILQNKDVNGFFAYPVTDSIAPGYSNIIHHPMDFSTMETKIERNEYRSVMEYKKDFMLMCNNATIYNRPETVYYKEAKRLIHLGSKQLSKDRLLTLKKTQSWLANLTLAEIGIDENGKVLEEMPPVQEEAKPKEKPKSKSTKTVGTPFEPFPDNLSPEEILEQAQDAAKAAHQELTVRKPKTDLAFLRRNKKGVTSLNILNPDNEGIVSNTERVVDLAEIVGKLSSGTGTLPSYKEDKRNKLTPIQYVNYGPFSSFAPQYDSSFANINKEESDLLLATYGDETGVQYAKSVQGFVDSAGDYAVRMVNNLLDMLTKGQHTRTNHALEQQRKLERERAAAAAAEEAENAAQSSASSQGVTSPQGDTAATGTEGSEVDPIQSQLNRTAEMIEDLQQAQNSRLSQNPPAHLSHLPGPSDREMELASKVTEGLVSLSRTAAPGDLVSVNSVRKAMGIAAHPPTPPQPFTDTAPCIADGEPVPNADTNNADVVHIDDNLEPLENLPSAGTAASESVAASHATEDEDEEEEDDEEEEAGVAMGESSVLGEEEQGGEEGSMAEEGVSQDPADLSEFFPSPPVPQVETSMDVDS
ncbi:bromodomain-containing protein 7-like isoform X2 [Babylonia areolata]|uniref:bromodomain-containing protein 7-like isoform X2 n=1 Tax=Babylonia areolata TaxID=304850 RepID=UPI003FD30B11